MNVFEEAHEILPKDPIERIRDRLEQAELLAQLAEEATELAQAALKLRRAYEGTNPTPKTPRAAREALLEEVADVSACLTCLGYDSGMNRLAVERITQAKMERWANRLEGKA